MFGKRATLVGLATAGLLVSVVAVASADPGSGFRHNILSAALAPQEATGKRALRGHDAGCVGCSDGDRRWVETFGDQPDAEEDLEQTAWN